LAAAFRVPAPKAPSALTPTFSCKIFKLIYAP